MSFLGGVIAYANRIKQDLLQVPSELLEREGAVSAAVAQAMAEGARRQLGTDWGVAVTGVAGPGGGSDSKPVGLVTSPWPAPMAPAIWSAAMAIAAAAIGSAGSAWACFESVAAAALGCPVWRR